MSSSKSSNLPRLSPLQRGIIALLKRNIPLAYDSFMQAYHSPRWQQRDAAVTGLGDLLDPRTYEEDKPPAVIANIGWQPPDLSPSRKPYIPNDRLLVLRDTFLTPTLWRAQNLNEQKTLHSFCASKKALERILINDAHPLVRTSAVILLWEFFGDMHLHRIRETLERAYRREKDVALRFVLRELLKM